MIFACFGRCLAEFKIGRIGMIGVTALLAAAEGYRIDQERAPVPRRC